MKYITLLLVLFSCAAANGENNDWLIPYDKTYENAMSSDGSHLYINIADEINSLDLHTITYYFTSEEPNEVIYDSFKEFSHDIGSKNGAVYIPLNNKSLKQFKSNVKKQDKMYKYAKVSNCDFSKVTANSLLFEIRDLSLNEEDRCILFPIKNDALWLSSVLKNLNININKLKDNSNLDSLKKGSIMAILMNGIDTSLNDQTIEKNKPAIRKLVNWISTFFKDTSSK